MEDSPLVFVESDAEDLLLQKEALPPWKVLIVDDEIEVHHMTKMVLKHYTYKEKKLEFLSGYGTEDTYRLLQEHRDIALILLDVVMEEEDSGLQVVRFIRNKLENHTIRIILRTGQPGKAPEEKITQEYDINDYKEKSELTIKKLSTSVTTSLRNYHDLLVIQNNARKMEQISKTLQGTYDRLAILDGEKMKILRFLSHEINTPLNAMSATHIFDVSTMSQENKMVLGLVESGFDRLKSLVKAFIEYFEFMGGKLSLTRKQVPVFEILQRIIDEQDFELKEAGVQIKLQVPEGLTWRVDPIYFKRVLSIIIQNTGKFSPNGGTVLIQGEAITDSRTRISIHDQGKGIRKENLSNIFEAFAIEQHDRAQQGFGLNLPVAKYIVENHNGKVWATSEGENLGTTFFIEV